MIYQPDTNAVRQEQPGLETPMKTSAPEGPNPVRPSPAKRSETHQAIKILNLPL